MVAGHMPYRNALLFWRKFTATDRVCDCGGENEAWFGVVLHRLEPLDCERSLT